MGVRSGGEGGREGQMMMVGTHIHVHAAREEGLARRVEQQHALDQVEGVDDQEVVLAVAAAHDQPVERGEQALRNVPLEALLQLEELAEGRVARQVGQHLARRLLLLFPLSPWLGHALLPRAARPGQADLREQALDLLQALLDLAAVEGRQVVEGEG